jgi:hypothetical protein
MIAFVRPRRNGRTLSSGFRVQGSVFVFKVQAWLGTGNVELRQFGVKCRYLSGPGRKEGL